MINPIAAIKAYFAVNTFVKTEIQEAKQMNGAKPGWKTSEFWMDMATKLGIVWGSVAGFIPPKWAAIITAGGTAVYVIARTIAKAVTDIKAAQADNTTTVSVATTAK